jgi:hypothetical protein
VYNGSIFFITNKNKKPFRDFPNTNNYVLSSKKSNLVAEVPGDSASAGIQPGLWNYTGSNAQKWLIDTNVVGTYTNYVLNPEIESENLLIYPNPAKNGQFEIMFSNNSLNEDFIINILNTQGQPLYSATLPGNLINSLDTGIKPVIYILQLRLKNKIVARKFEVY